MKETAQGMGFVKLQHCHARALLDFEQENRTFFESLIAPRDHDFYSLGGVLEHINALSRRELSHNAKSYVLIDGNQILARANIKFADDQGCAEIGYRVAQNSAGKGLGSLCVRHLITAARSHGLSKLVAQVMLNNPASERVLLKNGFVPTLCLPNQFCFRGETLHGMEYQRPVHESAEA